MVAPPRWHVYLWCTFALFPMNGIAFVPVVIPSETVFSSSHAHQIQHVGWSPPQLKVCPRRVISSAADTEIATDGSGVGTSQASEIDARRASGALGVIRRAPATSVEGIVVMCAIHSDDGVTWLHMLVCWCNYGCLRSCRCTSRPVFHGKISLQKFTASRSMQLAAVSSNRKLNNVLIWHRVHCWKELVCGDLSSPACFLLLPKS